ncbi:TasA family protein [Arthrobacter flavus]|uniref:TasA family protein n=1 Tax=Arthrobacter flavus TaxID=95172 RepID=A0ABW4Q7U3_9MICC
MNTAAIEAQPVSRRRRSAEKKSFSRSRRLLLPIAALFAATALVAGSGADFVSTSVNTSNAYTTGTLTQSNSKANAAVFNLSNVKPGDTLNGAVTITNTGSLASTFTLKEAATNGFTTKANLKLVVTQQGVTAPVFSGTFGELGTASLGTFAPGEARTFTFSTNLAQTAGNEEQGKTATATYTWDAVQAAATATNQ